MISVEVTNLTNQRISEKTISSSIKKNIKKLRQKREFSFLKNIELSVAFIGEAEMKKINKKYRGKDKPTDELSFTLEKTKNKLSGEILLCPSIIKSKSYSPQTTNYSLKLNHLLTHALLHLCGYDHETEKEWREMDKLEKIIAN